MNKSINNGSKKDDLYRRTICRTTMAITPSHTQTRTKTGWHKCNDIKNDSTIYFSTVFIVVYCQCILCFPVKIILATMSPLPTVTMLLKSDDALHKFSCCIHVCTTWCQEVQHKAEQAQSWCSSSVVSKKMGPDHQWTIPNMVWWRWSLNLNTS